MTAPSADPSPGALPNLVLPGVQKAGTTALFRLLTGHRDVTAPAGKEPHVFSSRDPEGRMAALRDGAAGDARYRLDASTSYFFSEIALRRVRERCPPDVRLIVSLRSPLERALSAYHQLRAQKVYGTLRWYEERDPEACVGLEARSAPELRAREDERLRRARRAGSVWVAPYRHFEDPLWPYRYLSNSLYGERVRLLLRLFGRDRVLFVEHGALQRRPMESATGIFRFLGLEPQSPERLARTANPTRVPRRGPLRDVVHLLYPYLRKALATRALDRPYRKALWGPPRRRTLPLPERVRGVFARDLEGVAETTGIEIPLDGSPGDRTRAEAAP